MRANADQSAGGVRYERQTQLKTIGRLEYFAPIDRLSLLTTIILTH